MDFFTQSTSSLPEAVTSKGDVPSFRSCDDYQVEWTTKSTTSRLDKFNSEFLQTSPGEYTNTGPSQIWSVQKQLPISQSKAENSDTVEVNSFSHNSVVAINTEVQDETAMLQHPQCSLLLEQPLLEPSPLIKVSSNIVSPTISQKAKNTAGYEFEIFEDEKATINSHDPSSSKTLATCAAQALACVSPALAPSALPKPQALQESSHCPEQLDGGIFSRPGKFRPNAFLDSIPTELLLDALRRRGIRCSGNHQVLRSGLSPKDYNDTRLLPLDSMRKRNRHCEDPSDLSDLHDPSKTIKKSKYIGGFNADGAQKPLQRTNSAITTGTRCKVPSAPGKLASLPASAKQGHLSATKQGRKRPFPSGHVLPPSSGPEKSAMATQEIRALIKQHDGNLNVTQEEVQQMLGSQDSNQSHCVAQGNVRKKLEPKRPQRSMRAIEEEVRKMLKSKLHSVRLEHNEPFDSKKNATLPFQQEASEQHRGEFQPTSPSYGVGLDITPDWGYSYGFTGSDFQGPQSFEEVWPADLPDISEDFGLEGYL